VYGRRFDRDGNAIGGEFLVSNTAIDEQHPEIAALSDGSFVIVWAANKVGDGIVNGIQGQRYDRNGEPFGEQFTVSIPDSYQVWPAIDKLPNGDFVVTWQTLETDNQWNFYGQRFGK